MFFTKIRTICFECISFVESFFDNYFFAPTKPPLDRQNFGTFKKGTLGMFSVLRRIIESFYHFFERFQIFQNYYLRRNFENDLLRGSNPPLFHEARAPWNSTEATLPPNWESWDQRISSFCRIFVRKVENWVIISFPKPICEWNMGRNKHVLRAKTQIHKIAGKGGISFLVLPS